MEIFFGFIAIVLAIIALWRAKMVGENNEQLTDRLTELELEVYRLRQKNSGAPTTPAAKTVPVPAAEMDVVVPPPPLIPEMPDTPGMEEISPGIFGVADSRPAPPPPVIAPPPVLAFAKTVEPHIATPKSETVANPPIITAKTELPPLPEPPPVAEKASFEMRLGTFWLVRAGIVMLLTGLAFFANFAYHNIIGKLGPAGKISLLYLASGLLLAVGAWLQRRTAKASLKNYAQVLFAGGLAAVYFTTYAAHHIPPLCVIENAVVDGTLLLAWAGVIMWIADHRKSEVMALFAVGLAFYSSVITRVGEFTLYSNLILTVAAVVFLVRNRWAGLSFASLATSYAGYTFWRFLHDDGWRWAAPDENLWLGTGFLASYWLVFTAATFLSRSDKLSGPNRAAFLTLNNGAFFALFLLTMLQVHTGGFWKFSLCYGTALLALALLAKKFLPDEPLAKNAYLTQGLLLVTLGFITKFAGFQLALVLGVESVVLFILGTQRQSVVLKFFAFAAALLATGWCAANLKQFDAPGLWTGAALGALMIFNACWAHRDDAENVEQPLRAEPSAFTLFAFAGWLAVTWFNSSAEHLPLVLAGEAVALTFSIYLLRVREITLLGQFFLIFAQLAWLFHFLNTTPPWWNPLAIVAVTVGLSHWWQHQKILVISRNIFVCYSTLFALAAVAVVLVWLHPLVSPPSWLALTSLLAVAATIYGVATRVWALAVCGQIFLAGSAWEFFRQLWTWKPEWFFPLAPVAALVALSLATVGWFARKPDSDEAVRNSLLQIALVYRWTALAMSLCWLWQYVPDRQHVVAFMAAAVGVFALAIWRRNREVLIAASVYATVSLLVLWATEDLKMDVYWANLISLLALLVMQQILRRLPENFSLDEKIHGEVIFITGVSLWRFLSCWVTTSGIFLTMSWAGFAVLVFAAGMFLRERFHRWLGLGVLAAAVGRVVLVDVWKQETIYRVLTFMALGVALLVVGFIYNKYQDTIRKWL
jgi:uncharacterized membrane protein